MAVYPTTLARNPSGPDRGAAVHPRSLRTNFSPWRHVVPADWFWIMGDVTLSFFGKVKPDILRVSVIGQIVRTWFTSSSRFESIEDRKLSIS